MKSSTHLNSLIGSRAWDKELVMWIGTEKALQQVIGSTKTVTLDLLDLFEIDNLPADDESTTEQIRSRLQDRLRAIERGPGNRIVLLVKSIGLLARYNVGLKPFYDWFIGDFALAVLLLEHGAEEIEWPEEVRCDSNRLLSFFSEPGMVKEIFSTNE